MINAMEPINLVKVSFIASMGPFKWVMFIIAAIVIADVIFLSILKFSNSGVEGQRFKNGLSGLLVLGSMNAVVGMLLQITGIWQALSAIIVAADVSPTIIMEGLKASFSTTIFGLVTFVIAALAWLLLLYLPGRQS